VVVAAAARLVLPHCNKLIDIALLPWMVNATVLLDPLIDAVTVALRLEVTTAAAVAVKVAVVAPLVTSTEAGTVKADVRLLARVTVVPPSGAVLESVTVQVVVAAAAKLVLPHCNELIDIALLPRTVNATVLLDPLIDAVTVAL